MYDFCIIYRCCIALGTGIQNGVELFCGVLHEIRKGYFSSAFFVLDAFLWDLGRAWVKPGSSARRRNFAVGFR